MTTSTLLPRPADLSSLVDIGQMLVAGDKGLLAIDESIPTCNKRFAALGITQDEEARRAYRELIVTTPGLGDFMSGVILYDETIRQHTSAGVPFLDVLARAGIVAGIKVDLGAKPMAGHPGEKVTEGLDGLRQGLDEYAGMGARFAKWRAVFVIGDSTPSRACVEANAQALARYAALCQETGLVPIVEPEVLMDGEHTLARREQVTDDVLHEVFAQLHIQGVALEAMLLKPNMILPGLDCPIQDSVDAVAAGDSSLPTEVCARRRRRDRVPVRRPIRRPRHGPVGCDEQPGPRAAAVAGRVLLRPGDPGTRADDLGRSGCECSPRATSPALAINVQPGRPPRRTSTDRHHCRSGSADQESNLMTTHAKQTETVPPPAPSRRRRMT